MNSSIKALHAVRVLAIGLSMLLLSGCGRRPQTLVTGVNLRDIDGAPASFHGFYVADGITNMLRGSMQTNFSDTRTITCTARSLIFEFVGDQRAPHGFELTVSVSNGHDRTAHSEYGIRGHMSFHEDGSDEWLSEPFTDETK